jgi:hypothetical protein
MAVPFASLTFRVSVKVAPIDTRVLDAGDKLTVPTACATVRFALPLILPTVAVIVVVPFWIAVATPEELIVATGVVLVDAHVTV